MNDLISPTYNASDCYHTSVPGRDQGGRMTLIIGIAVTLAALFCGILFAVGMFWIAVRLWCGLKRRLNG